MHDLMTGLIDVDGPQGHAIAAAMREVAAADGIHEAEAELIRRFEKGLPPLTSEVDSAVINTDELRNAYVKSMVLVALSDGSVSELERELIAQKSAAVGIDNRQLSGVYTEVGKSLLSAFSGVQIYRQQAVEIGRGLGLDDSDIEDVLGEI
jgi:uncharacterized tellurite resistance protein B-like protein